MNKLKLNGINLNRLVPLLIFATFFIRLWFFWQHPFSGDESGNVEKAILLAKNLFSYQSPIANYTKGFEPLLIHNHPPIEILVILPSLLFAPKEASVRLVFITISLLAIFYSYHFLKKNFSKSVALPFLLLAGFSINAAWWSRTAVFTSLTMASSLLISLALINFHHHPSRKSLFILSLSTGLGLLIFQPLALFIPSVIWAVWSQKEKINFRYIYQAAALLVLLPALFYIPYIKYAAVNQIKTAGFNYLFTSKLNSPWYLIANLNGFWHDFVADHSLFLLVFLLSIPLVIANKLKFARQVFLGAALYFVVFLFKIRVAESYSVGIYGVLCLLAAFTLSTRKPLLILVIVFVLVVNTVGSLRLIRGQQNPTLFGSNSSQYIPSQIKKIGELIINCQLQDNETYLSTGDAWQISYYFGRHSLLETDGLQNRIRLIQFFSQDKIALEGKTDFIKAIHFKTGDLPQALEIKLRQKALSQKQFFNDTVLLYKNCF